MPVGVCQDGGVLRPYAAADLDAVLDVWEGGARAAYGFLDEEFFAREREAIAQQWMPLAETTVAEVDGQIVGFLSLIGNEVGAVFVDPRRHGEGIGRALMDQARASRPFLELNVFEENAIGRRFYATYGFEPVGRHVHEGTGRTELRLRLG